MLEDLDPNIIIPSILILIGTVWSAKIGIQAYRERRGNTEAEERAYAETSTPISPGNGTNALDVAHYAVSEARGATKRVAKLEIQFTRLQRAHGAAMGFIDYLDENWPAVRQKDRLPRRPDDAYYHE